MPLLFPFRIEIEFIDQSEYESVNLVEDGRAFCERLETALGSITPDSESQKHSAIWVTSKLGTLTHWGYFSIDTDVWSRFWSDISGAAALADLLKDTIDLHYAKRLEYYDARIGSPVYSEQLTKDAKSFPPFVDFWKYKNGTINQRADYNSKPIFREERDRDQPRSEIQTDARMVEGREAIVREWRTVRSVVPWALVVLILFGPMVWNRLFGGQTVEDASDKLDRIIFLLEQKSECGCCGTTVIAHSRDVIDPELTKTVLAELSTIDSKISLALSETRMCPTKQNLGWGTVTTLPNILD